MFTPIMLQEVNSFIQRELAYTGKSQNNSEELFFQNFFRVSCQQLSKEWNLGLGTLQTDAYKLEHSELDHMHGELNPYGFRLIKVGGVDFIDAPHIHVGNKIVGGYSTIKLVHDINGLFDCSKEIVINEHAKRMIQILWKGKNNMETMHNSSFFGDKLNLHKDGLDVGISGGQEINTKTETKLVEKVSDGYDIKRLQKYDMPVHSASIGEIASAMGESLDEVMNRRDIRAEDKVKGEFLGTTNENLSVMQKTYPSFYIPLALIGLEAVLSQNYNIDKVFNFDWSGNRLKPIAYESFEVDYGQEKRLNTEATRLCVNKPTGKKAVIKTLIESTMSGPMLKIEFISTKDEVNSADVFFDNLGKWMKENNYYKGKKIAANGSFLGVGRFGWDDFICDSDVKDSIFNDVIGFLNHADLYQKNNLPFKRGLILYGRPGCGKTLLGKVVANQVPASFIWVTAAQSGSSEFIKQIFELAREIAPSVLFFEDIDMYTVDRHFGVFNPKVGEMLAQMDGMDENHGIVVIATTNRLDVIESALAERPSRFDRRYCLDNMSDETREKMVQIKIGNAILEGITTGEIAQIVTGLNGCFIQEVIISAKRKAITRGDVSSDGIVILKKEVIQESACEVMQAFNISLDKAANGLMPSWGLGAVETTGFCKQDTAVISLKKLREEKEDGKSPEKNNFLEQLTLSVTQTPRNVNLTQPEKDDLDAEIKDALAATIKASDDKKKKDLLIPYVEDSSLKDFIVDMTGKRLEDIDWRNLKKSELRKIFRHFVICRNVRKIMGIGEDPLKDKKVLRGLLHAMDMLSDRYYWVHALARIDTEFGRKTNIPFNPYKDQTSPDGALNVYKYVTGQVPTKKQQEDKINRENGITVPETQKTTEFPEYQFNEPQVAENKMFPKNMK